MTTILAESTVGELVREVPNRARVFEALQIDYCCGGKVPLTEACSKRNLDVSDVVTRLAEADGMPSDDTLVDTNTMSLTELADHIESTHHAYLKEELPRLDMLTEKVARVHGDKDTRLLQVRAAFVALRDELIPHMMKEERILFPIVRQLESSTGRLEFHCGSVANPIRQMEHEHDQAGLALATLRTATDNYKVPDWACNTYRAMLDALQRLEANMHQHVHKENNVLFPRAIAMESSFVEK